MDIDLVRNFAKTRLKDDPSGHDYYHCVRVAELAKKLLLMDNITSIFNANLVEIMSYLHDTIDDKICTNIEQTLIEIDDLLNKLKLTSEDKYLILNCIQHMSYSKNLKHKYIIHPLGRYVQDADRLDALGAIGIARAFAYGGSRNRLIYDPKIPIVNLVDYEQYRTHKTTTINHFYEKLLNLEKYMNTNPGKIIAKNRTEYMKDFLQEFKKEWI